MSTTNFGRRRFIRQVGLCGLAGAATAGGLTVLSGCEGKEAAEKAAAQPHNAVKAAQEAADPCNDLSSLTQPELAVRETFEYEARSADGTDLCRTCEFWRPAADGGPCGTCTIVKGPVHPLGTCISWAEIT